MKPWLSEPRGRQLEAFVGVWNIKTHQFKTSKELIWFGLRLFGLDPVGVDTVERAAGMIEDLGKKERAVRARENRDILFPLEDLASEPSASPVTEEALDKMMADSKPQMVDGASQDCVGELDIDPAKLLLKVVSAVIGAGQAHILYDFPEVLEFTKSRIPSRAELAGHTNTDERMFEAKAKWPNLIPGTQI
jgi:hypothetical protein